MRLCIDRFEGDFAICQNMEGENTTIERQLLPESAREGDIISFDGEKYIINHNETADRHKAIREKMNRLIKKRN